MAVSRHLGYYRNGNSAIRSADPKNPCVEPNMEWIGCTVFEIFTCKLYCDLTLEANITSIGKTIAKLWPFLYIQDGRRPPSWILTNRN